MKPLVRLATPTANGQEPHPEYTAAVVELIRAEVKGRLPFRLEVLRLPCSHLPSGRDKLARAKLDGMGGILPDLSYKVNQSDIPYDYLLFVDSDQSFAVGDIVKLFDACRRNEAPTAAVTTPRSCPGRLNAGGWKAQPGLVDLTPAPAPRRLKRVSWFGAGCVMIPADTFRRLPFPWFRDQVVYTPDGDAFITGEDVGFCLACEQHGIPLYADFGIYITHHTGEDIPAGPDSTPAKGQQTMATKKTPAPKAPTAPTAPAAPKSAQTPPALPASIQMAQMARANRQDWDTACVWMENAEKALNAAYARIAELEKNTPRDGE